MKRHAFTLIELLVVIAIIALLVAILMPALSKAKALAISASCQVNQRSVGMSQAMYLNDNNGFTTIRNDFWAPNKAAADIPVGSYSGEQVRWFDVLSKYIIPNDFPLGYYDEYYKNNMGRRWADAMGPLYCPAATKSRFSEGWWPTNFGVPVTVVITYAQAVPEVGRVPGQGDDLYTQLKGHDFNKVSQPSSVVFLTEVGTSSHIYAFTGTTEANVALETNGRADWIYDHMGRLNYLFMDGHVGGNLWEPPHALDFREGQFYQWRAPNGGTRIYGPGGGTRSFLNRFHGGKAP